MSYHYCALCDTFNCKKHPESNEKIPNLDIQMEKKPTSFQPQGQTPQSYEEILKEEGYSGPVRIENYKCPSCHNPNFFFKTAPPISADEPIRVFYKCADCKCKKEFQTYKR